MPFYPSGRVDLLPEATTQTPIVPRLAILHTNAGGSSTTGYQLRAFMFRGDITLECHFQIDLDGTVHQYMPVTVRADCNAAANPFAVSIETQDLGGATVDVTPWTPAQCTSIVALLRWLHDTAAIPMVRCTRWDGAGVGAHRDFPQWSAASHSCPGVARFAQVPGLIAAAAYTPPTLEESPMAELGYFRDDRPNGWQIWVVALDALGAVWCCPISDLPDRGKWEKVQPVVGDPPLKSFTALAGLMDAQNRPGNIGGAFHDHVHDAGLQPTTTGGVVP